MILKQDDYMVYSLRPYERKKGRKQASNEGRKDIQNQMKLMKNKQANETQAITQSFVVYDQTKDLGATSAFRRKWRKK